MTAAEEPGKERIIQPTNAGQHPDAGGSRRMGPDMVDEVERLRSQVDRIAATMAWHRRK